MGWDSLSAELWDDAWVRWTLTSLPKPTLGCWSEADGEGVDVIACSQL